MIGNKGFKISKPVKKVENQLAWVSLKKLLSSLGYAPLKEVNDESLPEDFFNVVVTKKGDGKKYGLIKIGELLCEVDVNPGLELEHVLLALECAVCMQVPETNPN